MYIYIICIWICVYVYVYVHVHAYVYMRYSISISTTYYQIRNNTRIFQHVGTCFAGLPGFANARHLFTTLYLDVSIPALEAHTRPVFVDVFVDVSVSNFPWLNGNIHSMVIGMVVYTLYQHLVIVFFNRNGNLPLTYQVLPPGCVFRPFKGWVISGPTAPWLQLTRFGLKVAPSEHQQIFDSVDKLVKGLFKELDVVSLGGVSTFKKPSKLSSRRQVGWWAEMEKENI